MPDPHRSAETTPVVTLDSLPDGGFSTSQIDSLNDSEPIELAAPLVIDLTMSRISHVDLVFDDTHHFLGWSTTKQQWERLLVVKDTDDELVVESAVAVSDDESGEAVVELEPHGDIQTENLVDFVWEYVDCTYSNTDHLYNAMDDALEELSRDDQ
ncbi:hypothetical protein RBH26_09835 [Natronolimnohabitans sp. A-GB9]|uniref:hypothetical protein n=1 Tax=Natronolimnohabitans sp. A-GB9 TaxID=3069757 RepID=UPI0027B818BA|nr:hypothetical protein [Natronolimnohabitans sp. A-GB9]MDQ2050785.1 hypothetical protein [Natronolimnohabitans sp. A-GB9]